MAKSKETFNKKEKEKKRLKKRKEKQDKKEERKANAKKGQSLEDMMAFIDENGNLSDTPPDPRKKKVFKQEDIRLEVARPEDESSKEPRPGTIIFFDDSKGYGFINDQLTNERVFVHANNLSEPVKVSDKVLFRIEAGPRGPAAIQVTKVK